MTFEEILADKSEEIVSLCHTFRELALQADPRIEEGIYGGKVVKMALYHLGHKDNVGFGISPSNDHVKIFLHHTEKIQTGDLKLEGKGKHARHIKIRDIESVDKTDFLRIFKDISILLAQKS